MGRTDKKELGRQKRHRRLRKKIFGTKEHPRLCVHKSLNNLQAQLIDDVGGVTLFSLSTLSPKIKTLAKTGGNVKAAVVLGEFFAKEAKNLGITKIAFDRSGHLYHGRVKAFADAARKNGLVF